MDKIILGIDEAGRGPYAGPLVVGACILKTEESELKKKTISKIEIHTPNFSSLAKSERETEFEKNNLSKDTADWIDELNDSKKLTAKKREKLYGEIKQKAAASATGWVSAKELDEIGMSEALKLATRRAVQKIQAQKVRFNEIIIDGPVNFLRGTKLEKYVKNLNKADSLIKEVSAASILAKVERDHYMIELSKKYPEYGFDKHVGYGTAKHQQAMENFGLTPEHRRSFKPVAEIAKKFGENRIQDEKTKVEISVKNKNVVKNTTKEIGNFGEDQIVKLLEKNGHKTIARNYKTKLFEIDIISEKDDKFYFTEVKTRKNTLYGNPEDFINQKKLEKMKLGAKAFMKLNAPTKDFALSIGAVVLAPQPKIDWFELK